MFAKDGYDVIIKALVLAIVLLLIGWWSGPIGTYILTALAVAIVAFTLYFFRDPERSTPDGQHLIIAPADGKVISIVKVYEEKYFNKEVTQLSIFLSPLDVHVNRIPITGTVEFVRYVPGDYLVAWHEKASELNERSEFGVRHASGTQLFFRQITGYVARRIVFHIKEGDSVRAGDRFGMMKFGSRMDILFDADVDMYVKPGDITVGGESVIGKVIRT